MWPGEIKFAPTGIAHNQPPGSPLMDAASWLAAGEYFRGTVDHPNGEAVISERLRRPLASSMMGTLACAPEWEVHASSSGKGPPGGNHRFGEER